MIPKSKRKRFNDKFEEDVLNKAKSYSVMIAAKAGSSPDPRYFAYLLWSLYAVPSITYAFSVIPISSNTRRSIDSMQALIAKRMMNLPEDTHNICQFIEPGFKSLGYEMDKLGYEGIRRRGSLPLNNQTQSLSRNN